MSLIIGKPNRTVEEVKNTPFRTVEIHFYAYEGKAYARYFGPNVSGQGVEVEIKNRDSAVAMVRRAVERANEYNTTIQMLHGPESSPELGFCLSDEAYAACKTELLKTRNQYRGLFNPSF
jgi:hypothetical protein